MRLINATYFNLDFCKQFSEQKLRLIYKNESEETLSALIAECFPQEVEKPKAKKATK